MRLTIRRLVLVGSPLLVIGGAYLLLLGAFTCYDSGCGSESQEMAAVAEAVTGAAPFAILCAVPVTVAWILCLVQLVRAGRRGVAVAVALALPLAAALALWLYYRGTAGTWNPHHGSSLDPLGILLLWPLAIFVATFALRGRRRDGPLVQPANG